MAILDKQDLRQSYGKGTSRQLRTSQITLHILQLVRAQQLVSRSQLSEAIGMSRSSVGQYVDTLIRTGILKEGPEGESTGGRRSQLLRLDDDWGYIVGVDMGASGVDIGLCNLSTEIVDSVCYDIDMTTGPQAVLSRIVKSIGQLLERNGNPRLAAVGMGVPGPVNWQEGCVDAPPIMPRWDRFPIARWMIEQLNCRVYLDNDVNVMALGEQATGAGQGVKDFLVVKVGTGIGAGIIAGGVLQRGTNGCAGDMGHIHVTEESIQCACGRTGCLEAVASGAAIARIAEEVASHNPSGGLARLRQKRGVLTAKDVGGLAAIGDPEALAIVRQAGIHLGQALATVVNCLNPSLVVLSGGVLNMGDFYLAAVREYVYKRSLPLATRNLKITRSSVGASVGMLGAATLAIDELFTLENYHRLHINDGAAEGKDINVRNSL